MEQPALRIHPAKENPEKIKYLISEFKLEGIVSFDEVNKIITTTFIHNRFIRLSDLLSLNVSKVIAFTLPQYIQVIRQLFELLQEMKQLELKHGDLRMENILLDLTSSCDKLDNKPVEIIFQIKLINFAQFNNLQMEDDFERAFSIYRQITEYFPNYKNELDFKKLQTLNQDVSFIDYLQQQIINSAQFQQEQNIYSWDPNYFPNFIQKYSKKHLNIFNYINSLISELHQYHLILNHYPKLNYSYLLSFWEFNYLSEPFNFMNTLSKLNQVLDYNNMTININFQFFQILVVDNILEKSISSYKFKIEEELLCYLKKQGYLENIQKFVELNQNIDQLKHFNEYQFYKSIFEYSNKWNVQNIELPQEILKVYNKSSLILKTLVQLKNFKLKINELKTEQNELSDEVAQTTNILILTDKLDNIKKMGEKYSKLLIQNCINKHLATQLKSQCLSNVEMSTSSMVDSWLKWIDQYIFKQQFINIDQLSSINTEQFIEFIREVGFELMKQQMKTYIENVVDHLFKTKII